MHCSWAVAVLTLVATAKGLVPSVNQAACRDVRCRETMEETKVEAGYENPGRVVLNEMTLAKQARDLDALSAKWNRQREIVEWESSKLTGFSEQAEIINGRAAMFFIVTGLLTEYWTGQSIPEQVITLLRTTGVIGLG